MKSCRGEVTIIVIVVVTAVAGITWLLKPSLLGGASKRAANSTTATAELVKAVDNQVAAAAASVVKIGEANTMAPESPAKEFIRQEVPVALARLPGPDPVKLLEAERRRVAVMEGHLLEARQLYEAATKQSVKLQVERDAALAARRAADLALEQSAAAEHARTVQLVGFGAIIVLLAGGWIYTKVYSIGPGTIGLMAAEMRAGTKSPVQVLTDNLGPRFYGRVERAAKLATPLKEAV